jgi:large subunit ribosomal protein L35
VILSDWTCLLCLGIIPPPSSEGRFYLKDAAMGYKTKPNKSVAKRFKVTKTGKLKRHHAFTSHLMSARAANKRRKLRKPAVLSESLAKNMRRLMGVAKLKPRKVAHERALAAASAAKDGSAGGKKGDATRLSSSKSGVAPT